LNITTSNNRNLIIFAKAIVPEVGGIEVYSNSVAFAWAELGFQVTVITQYEGKIGIEERGPVKVINVGPGSQAAVFVRMIKAAWGLHRKFLPVLVHATTWRVAIPALLIFHKIPVVVTVHGREVTQMKGLMLWLMRMIFKLIDGSVVISKTTLENSSQLIPLLKKKAVIAWNGLSYRTEAKEKGKNYFNDVAGVNKPCRLFSLCRLVPRKNIAIVLKALSLVRLKGIENWEYLIAGSGEEERRLQDLTKHFSLEDKVHFLGQVPDNGIAELYREADIFVHPQISGHDGRNIEGFGLVIVDAMSFGLPVIAGRDGAPAEYIMQNQNGFIVDGHSVEQLSAILCQLITDPILRRRIGENARTWALETLTWENHVKRLLNIILPSLDIES
jgi:phosphatidyl-myo-inositol dimannoside synthase